MSISNMMSMGNRMYIIPQDVETREDILNIDRSTKEDIRLKHRLYLNSDWECNTVSNTVVEALVRILYSHIKDNGVHVLDTLDDNELDFYGLLTIAASNKRNESAEKTGNINVKFKPGYRVKEIIELSKNNVNEEYEFIAIDAAYSYPDDTDRTAAVLKVDKIARKVLADKYSLILPKDFQAVATAVVFLENLYKHLIYKVTSTEKTSTMINFNDIIEFHATRKGDEIDIRLRPGMGAKLIIKSDESTEDEDALSD